MDAEVKSALTKLIVVVGVTFVAIVALGFAFREQLVGGDWLFDRFGYLGIGIGIFAADMFTAPMPPDGFLLLAVTARANPVAVIAVASVFSILGGLGAYWIGTLLARTAKLKQVLEKAEDSGLRLIRRLGVVAVVIAAFTPVPFSLICYLAGSIHMPLKHFCAAILVRIPRMAFFYYLIAAAWETGA